MTEKKPSPGRPPVSLTQSQQIRLEAMRLAMTYPAWCVNQGFRDWREAVEGIAEWIETG